MIGYAQKDHKSYKYEAFVYSKKIHSSTNVKFYIEQVITILCKKPGVMPIHQCVTTTS